MTEAERKSAGEVEQRSDGREERAKKQKNLAKMAQRIHENIIKESDGRTHTTNRSIRPYKSPGNDTTLGVKADPDRLL